MVFHHFHCGGRVPVCHDNFQFLAFIEFLWHSPYHFGQDGQPVNCFEFLLFSASNYRKVRTQHSMSVIHIFFSTFVVCFDVVLHPTINTMSQDRLSTVRRH